MCLLVCDPAGPRAVPAARGALPQPTPEPLTLKAAANSLHRVLGTARCPRAGLTRAFARASANCCMLSAAWLPGGTKAGTLTVAPSPPQAFLVGRSCPGSPRPGRGRSRGMCPQQLGGMRSALSTSLGLWQVGREAHFNQLGGDGVYSGASSPVSSTPRLSGGPSGCSRLGECPFPGMLCKFTFPP